MRDRRFQARGLVHFHAIVRLDGAEDRATAPGVAVSPEERCDAIRAAAGSARLDGDAGDDETIAFAMTSRDSDPIAGVIAASPSSSSRWPTPPSASRNAPPRDLGRWVHMLGFRATSSRNPAATPINLAELRATGAAYRARQDEPMDDDDTALSCCRCGNTSAPATSTLATCS